MKYSEILCKNSLLKFLCARDGSLIGNELSSQNYSNASVMISNISENSSIIPINNLIIFAFLSQSSGNLKSNLSLMEFWKLQNLPLSLHFILFPYSYRNRCSSSCPEANVSSYFMYTGNPLNYQKGQTGNVYSLLLGQK